MFKKLYLMTFLLLGVSMFGVTLNLFMDRHQFLQVAVGAEARILKHNIIRIRGKEYRPVFSFFDQTGKMFIVESERGFKEPAYRQDQRVPILYDPRDPYVAIVDSFLDIWGHTLMSGLFATFAFCLGITIHKRYRGNR